jgi:tellurite resistance protein TehA-like permease
MRAQMFVWLSVFFFLLMIRIAPVFGPVLKHGFMLSWFAFAFPLDAFAVAFLELAHALDHVVFDVIGWVRGS